MVVDYCYMLRNRSFHANKAYPLFMFDSGEEECTVEDILTKLLLMTIEGILKANMSTEGWCKVVQDNKVNASKQIIIVFDIS